VSETFVLRLPDRLDPAGAAPLLCAGITTWSPLRHWKVGKGTQVAGVGLGGLGHMALKLAKALGAEVPLFTRSPGKAEDARRLGADRIVLSTDAQQMAEVQSRFDLIIDTVPYVHDVNPYIPTLAVSGTLVLVGYLGELAPALDTSPMVLQRKAVAGSRIGGIAETQELLDFCGEHGITSDVEVITIQGRRSDIEASKRAKSSRTALAAALARQPGGFRLPRWSMGGESSGARDITHLIGDAWRIPPHFRPSYLCAVLTALALA
jgi:uncharacterized zinc-type alcohol dehydrogenase-like protein